MKTIKFLKSPLAFGLGYSAGETGTFETNQANELIDLEIAEEVIEETIIGISSEAEETIEETIEEVIETADKKAPATKEKAVKK
jgi:hypothetical protein